MMAGKNQAALAVCAQTKVIFPFNSEILEEIVTHTDNLYASSNLSFRLYVTLVIFVDLRARFHYFLI